MACRTRCDVKASDFRHDIVIQSPRENRDAGGGFGDPWADPIKVAAARAKIQPLRGNERLRAMQLEDTVTHRITMRYRAGITAKMRVKFGARLFNIRAVIDPEERNRFLELMCEEGVAT